jgi:hypothetical protein
MEGVVGTVGAGVSWYEVDPPTLPDEVRYAVVARAWGAMSERCSRGPSLTSMSTCFLRFDMTETDEISVQYPRIEDHRGEGN